MTASKVQRVAFVSPPFFSASWVGRDPRHNKLRMVHCFGPSEPDDFAALHAAVLGLESLAHRQRPPALSKVWGELEEDRLVLHVRAYDEEVRHVLRTDPLPASLVNVLHLCPEVLLLWVDVPLRDPPAGLSLVGLTHIWTGVAPIRDGVGVPAA